MKDVLHKRNRAFYTKNAKTAGDLRADTLASLQTKKPPAKNKNGFFAIHHWTNHAHTWLFGTDNAVCSQCGKTVPKDKTQEEQ